MNQDEHPPSFPPRADGRLDDWPATPSGEGVLFDRLRRLCEEGLDTANRLVEGRKGEWHSFVPAEYDEVLRALLEARSTGGRFLEMGSGLGVIAIMADLLGFEAYGIEIVEELVAESRRLAGRFESEARFVNGSFLPADFKWVSDAGDSRLGAIGIGDSAYPELGFKLADFDWVYAYPWPGEGEVLRGLMDSQGGAGARLLLQGYTGGIDVYPPSA